MRRSACILLLNAALLLGSSPLVVRGQDLEPSEPDSPVQPTSEPEAEQGASAPSEPTGGGEQDLFEQTIARDIASAGFYELVAWLQSLGLPVDGERSALQRRLAQFYEVSPEQLQSAREEFAPPTGQEQTERSIVIDSASRTRYFTIDEIDERYIRLSGDVVVTLTDENQGTHRIRANEITFNQEQNTLSASGSVVYTLDRGETTERFVGEALAVQLDSFEGAFIRGQTEREQQIEGETVDFEFAGEYITRSEDDVIVLDNGRVTSSQANPPNYHIRARKIWVLAPGEWGLSNATLYVGRVPLFYFPFFFRPGNRLFFNPSIGSNDRSGWYIQTTTYLRGEPEERESAFSFLQLTEGDGSPTRLERDGLFLARTDASAEPPPEGTVRLMVDLYTKLGAFAGVEGELPEAAPLRDIDFYAALAASRHLYLTASGYTPYFVADGDAGIDWNETSLGSLSLPFRFGLSFASSLAEGGWAANVNYAWYSDQRFLVDFGNRAEQMDWAGILGQGDFMPPPAQITNLTWTLAASYNPSAGSLPSFVTSGRFDAPVLSLRFSSRPVPISLLEDEILLADQSPEAAFFYPTTMRLPDIGGRLSGTLYEYPREAVRREDPDEQLPPISSPWSEDEEEPISIEEDDSAAIVAPPLQPSLPAIALVPAGFSADVSYLVNPRYWIDHEFDATEWQLPEDVDFGIRHRSSSAQVFATNGLSIGVLDSFLDLASSLSFNAQQRTNFDRAPTVDDAAWDALEAKAYEFTSVSLGNTNILTVNPLLYVPALEESRVQYSTELLLYRYTFDEVVDGEPRYVSGSIDWDSDEYVRKHELSGTLAVRANEVQQLTLAAVLPPLDERYRASLTLRRKPFVLTATTARALVNDEWSFDPLVASLTVTFPSILTLRNELNYNLNDGHLSFFSSDLKLGDLEARFEARRTVGYTFEGVGSGWVPDSEEEFRPVSFTFSYEPRLVLEPFWRGRMAGTLNADIGINVDFLRFTQSALNFGLNGTFAIHEFMALGFSVFSSNSQAYAYVPALARSVGREPIPLFADLLRGVNFFSEADRRASGFNFDSFNLGLIHDLGDWDFSVVYRAAPELQTVGPDAGRYTIDRFLDLTLRWRPISELSASGTFDEGEFRIGDDS
ncbi:MAG: hypothetical protein ACLFNT_05165 [Spirochaetales bacterium]